MVNTKRIHPSCNQEIGDSNAITRMRSSMKRPRAPIACIRCHHKKIRCDGEHPNCARCTQGGILCAYPSSRRSRNTPPASMDPFIDNLSQLEIKIHQIEANLKTQRSLFLSFTANANVAMVTNNNLGTKSKHTEKSTLFEAHAICMTKNQLKNYPQTESSRKRPSPSFHFQDNSGSIKGSKRQKRSITPKIKTSSSPTTLPLSPSSTSSSLSKTTMPFINNDKIGHSPASSLSHNYLSPALDPFAFQTDWTQTSSAGANNGMTPHVIYSGQIPQVHPSIYSIHEQRPLFLPQDLSPQTATPDYTDDSSGQFHLITSTPPTSFHYPNKPDNDHHHHHHHYSLSSPPYSSHTLASLSATSPPSAHSSSTDTLSHTPSSQQIPSSQQTPSCHMIDIYNNFTMDDLISFDSQNTGMPLIDNAVWYC